MRSAPGLVALADGTRVWVANNVEAAILNHELVDQRVYARHGITVHDGDCIFDVGANIGLYSVLLMRAQRGLRIFAFEPVAASYVLLERNLALYRGEGETCVRAFRCALGRVSGTALVEIGPGRFDHAATLRPLDVSSAVRRDASLLVWTQAWLSDLGRSGQLSRRWERLLHRGLAWWPTQLPCMAAVVALLVQGRLRAGVSLTRRRYHCDVRTLSEVIRTYQVDRVDLLKVDVEGSEWEVLAGVEPTVWERIQQVVVEVHDVAGRVNQIAELLQAHGFHLAVDQEDWAVHPLLGIATVYAWRPISSRGPEPA
jgi:hypothetical protein